MVRDTEQGKPFAFSVQVVDTTVFVFKVRRSALIVFCLGGPADAFIFLLGFCSLSVPSLVQCAGVHVFSHGRLAMLTKGMNG